MADHKHCQAQSCRNGRRYFVISKEYKQSLQTMYTKKVFQGKLAKYDLIKEFINTYNPETMIDYGCGIGRYIDAIQKDYSIPVTGFDPGVPEYATMPTKSAQCLICNDVIEHIEPEYLETTLHKIQSLFDKAGWFIIACYPAKKTLPDGRNAHLVIQEPAWWRNKIEQTFTDCNIVKWEEYRKLKNKPEIRMVLEK